jgi:hypothetical protein
LFSDSTVFVFWQYCFCFLTVLDQYCHKTRTVLSENKNSTVRKQEQCYQKTRTVLSENKNSAVRKQKQYCQKTKTVLP